MGGSKLTQVAHPHIHDGSINVLCAGRVLGADAGKFAYMYCFSSAEAAMRLVKYGDTKPVLARWRHKVLEVQQVAHQCAIVWVFDGRCPGKGSTKVQRDTDAQKAVDEADALMLSDKPEDREKAGKKYTNACRLTLDLAAQLIDVCRTVGASYTIAPEEADAQLAYMVEEGKIWAAIMDDADGLAMRSGIKRQVLNMTANTS